MKHRNPVIVVLLTLITFGIYGIVWSVLTAREMRTKGADIPNAILLIIPFVNWYWLWKYSQGVEKITNAKYSAAVVFILFFFTGIGGQIISQLGFNEADAQTSQPAPVTSESPAFTQPVPINPTTTGATAGVVGAPQTAPVQPETNAFEQPAFVAQAPAEPMPVVPPSVSETPQEVESAPEVPAQSFDMVVEPQPNLQVASPSEPVVQPTPVQDMPPVVAPEPQDPQESQDPNQPNRQA